MNKEIDKQFIDIEAFNQVKRERFIVSISFILIEIFVQIFN